MQSSFKKLPGSLVELEVVLDQKEFKGYWDDAYNYAVANIHLKGFRPGTAPKELADAAIDKEKVFSEAANDAVRNSLDEISKDNNWVIIDKPQVTVDEHNTGLKYKVVLTIFPEVKLGNYKKIAKQIFSEFVESAKLIKVEPAEVDKAIEWVRQSRKPRRADLNKNNEVGAPTGASEKDGRALELNDEFVKTLGNFQNVEEFRKNITDGLRMEKEFREKDKTRARVLEEIIKDSKIDVPNIMIERTLDRIAGDKKDLRDKFRDKAKENVLGNLVLYKIAEEEKLDFDPEKGVDGMKVFDYLENLASK